MKKYKITKIQIATTIVALKSSSLWYSLDVCGVINKVVFCFYFRFDELYYNPNHTHLQ